MFIRSLLAATLLACCTLTAGEAPAPAAAVKVKRKFCNSTLPGDYRYETCGEFCKSAKARNHCQYCKCHTCTFCPTEAIAASKRKQVRSMKKKGPFSKPKGGAPKTGAAVAEGGEKPLKKKGKKGKGGKKGGFKRRAKQIGQTD